MINRLSRRNLAIAAATLFAVAPVAAWAQDDAVTYDPATITITAKGGAAQDYQVGDVSVYVSTTPAYDDVPASTSMSVSLTALSPIDDAILQWSTQAEGASGTLRNLVIVAKSTDSDGAAKDVRYEITGAHVTSVSSSFSTYAPHSLSLSIEADKLTIDGVAMN